MSHVCDLHYSPQQQQIHNTPREARDRTCILIDTSQIHLHWAMMGTPCHVNIKDQCLPAAHTAVRKTKSLLSQDHLTKPSHRPSFCPLGKVYLLFLSSILLSSTPRECELTYPSWCICLVAMKKKRESLQKFKHPWVRIKPSEVVWLGELHNEVDL